MPGKKEIKMNVLVINTGSSSLKYQLLDMEDQTLMASGLIERIGEEKGIVSHKKYHLGKATKTEISCEIKDHRKGMHLVIEMITGSDTGVIKKKSEIDLIGHRVVQGGESSKGAKLITESVKKAIKDNNPLAPLHNPANLMGIEVAEELLAGISNIAVFDTDFHSTMPPHAYIYPLPYEFYTDLKIRRYGFHGTSHKFVSQSVARSMGKNPEDINVITVHLGNGGSIAAVKNGLCIDTSMGMTPLAGVMMGTRCGDIDPAIAGYIAENKGIKLQEVNDILNKDSGLKGICGMNDMRDIHASVQKGDKKAKLALDMFAYRVKKYIGAYYAALGSVDAIVFTAGIGENDDIIREKICSNLNGLGIELDLRENQGRISISKKISTEKSPVQLWVIPTNEELQIAMDAVELMQKKL
jgi:acetate kinase